MGCGSAGTGSAVWKKPRRDRTGSFFVSMTRPDKDWQNGWGTMEARQLQAGLCCKGAWAGSHLLGRLPRADVTSVTEGFVSNVRKLNSGGARKCGVRAAWASM